MLAQAVERVLASSRFLAATAVCCGLCVAFAMWAVGGGSGGARALAGLIGLAAGLAVMLLIAAAAAEETPTAPVAAPIAPVEVSEPAPRDPGGDGALARLLAEGRSLREQLQPGSIDPRVDAWLQEVGAAIEAQRPGAAGYLEALALRSYPDDGLRLDAYTRRLATVVRGY